MAKNVKGIPFFIIIFLWVAIAKCQDSELTFPEQYQGIWDASASACSNEYSNARVTITSLSVEYWESSGIITFVEKSTPTELHVKLAMTGEGEEWISVTKFKLSASNSKLTSYFEDGKSFNRFRCNKNAYSG